MNKDINLIYRRSKKRISKYNLVIIRVTEKSCTYSKQHQKSTLLGIFYFQWIGGSTSLVIEGWGGMINWGITLFTVWIILAIFWLGAYSLIDVRRPNNVFSTERLNRDERKEKLMKIEILLKCFVSVNEQINISRNMYTRLIAGKNLRIHVVRHEDDVMIFTVGPNCISWK